MWWTDRRTIDLLADDLDGSVEQALFVLHSAGREALLKSASDPFGSKRDMQNVLLEAGEDEHIGAVCKAFDDASGIEGYGASRVARLKLDADRGAEGVITKAMMDGVPWEGAARRAAAVYGIPAAQASRIAKRLCLGDYSTEADKQLNLWAMRTSDAERQEISKNMVTTHTDEDGNLVTVMRDESGRFAAKESKRKQRTEQFVARERSGRSTAPARAATAGRGARAATRTARPAAATGVEQGESREERLQRIRRKRKRRAGGGAAAASGGGGGAPEVRTAPAPEKTVAQAPEKAVAQAPEKKAAPASEKKATSTGKQSKKKADQGKRAAADVKGQAIGRPRPLPVATPTGRANVPVTFASYNNASIYLPMSNVPIDPSTNKPLKNASVIAYHRYLGNDRTMNTRHNDTVVVRTNAIRDLFSKLNGDMTAFMLVYEKVLADQSAHQGTSEKSMKFRGITITPDAMVALRSMNPSFINNQLAPTGDQRAHDARYEAPMDRAYRQVADQYRQQVKGNASHSITGSGELAGVIAGDVVSDMDIVFNRDVDAADIQATLGGTKGILEAMTNGRSTPSTRAVARGMMISADLENVSSYSDHPIAPFVTWNVSLRAENVDGAKTKTVVLDSTMDEAGMKKAINDAMPKGVRVAATVGPATVSKTLPPIGTKARADYIYRMEKMPLSTRGSGTGDTSLVTAVDKYVGDERKRMLRQTG